MCKMKQSGDRISVIFAIDDLPAILEAEAVGSVSLTPEERRRADTVWDAIVRIGLEQRARRLEGDAS